MVYRLLIVEDEPVIRQGLIRLLALETHGYMLCGEAENGSEAAAMIEAHNPHVVITDIKMPLMDGLELIRRVNESGWPKPKFILLSGYREFDYARKALRYGVTDYLLKPVDEDELIALLKKTAEELRKDERKRFKEAAVKALIGLTAAVENDRLPELMGSVWEGPYRYVGISIHEAFHRQFRDQVISMLDVMKPDIIAVALPGEDGSDLGMVFSGPALREIGDDWGSLADELNVSLSGCAEADTLPEPYLYIGEQVEELQSLRSSYRTAVMACHAAVLSDKRFTVSGKSGNLSGSGVIGEIQQFIREHYREPITLKEMGKANYIHPIYLGQLFKKTTGLHFKDYLHKVRIEEAKLLLRKSDLKVYEIAGNVGYADQDYFMDKFKKLAGMTPTQYREKQMTGWETG
ncbi:response regulator [Paenibacillus solisilvae]|uniref:Response regulator n=1 Tax=Paenibacillus solisilvae TaxID=2486751 RepID=A0ABW0VX45_9BACL